MPSKISKIFLPFLFCLPVSVAAEIPILGFIGAYSADHRLEDYRAMRDAGFDVSVDGYDTTGEIIQSLNLAQQVGIKLMVAGRQIMDFPAETAGAVRHHPALFGYMLGDEPRMADFDTYRHRYHAIRAADPAHLCYQNLFPYYGDELLETIGAASYEEYLRKFSEIPLPQISFDFYPIWDYDIRPTWYYTLEAVRRESLRTGVPFWAFVLSTPHVGYPQPTLEMLRLQIYSNLAYGAQAIQYFTFRTPPQDDTYDYHNGPITLDGKKTETYNIVREMNRELREVIPFFDGCTVERVGHLLEVPLGTERFNGAPRGLRRLKVVGTRGAVVSVLRQGDKRYLAVVNKDFETDLRVDIAFSSPRRPLWPKAFAKAPAASSQSLTLSGCNLLIFELD
ncbi:MAG: beta-galactosidase [Bacteroidales bacterium]|nr:beta-galactosidase [Bacteroidales bacterium]